MLILRLALTLLSLLVACDPVPPGTPSPIPPIPPSPSSKCHRLTWAGDCMVHCAPETSSFGVVQCYEGYGALFNFGATSTPSHYGYWNDYAANCGVNFNPVRFYELTLLRQPDPAKKLRVDPDCRVPSSYSGSVAPPFPIYYGVLEVPPGPLAPPGG